MPLTDSNLVPCDRACVDHTCAHMIACMGPTPATRRSHGCVCRRSPPPPGLASAPEHGCCIRHMPRPWEAPRACVQRDPSTIAPATDLRTRPAKRSLHSLLAAAAQSADLPEPAAKRCRRYRIACLPIRVDCLTSSACARSLVDVVDACVTLRQLGDARRPPAAKARQEARALRVRLRTTHVRLASKNRTARRLLREIRTEPF